MKINFQDFPNVALYVYYCIFRQFSWRFARKFKLKLIFEMFQRLKPDAKKATLRHRELETKARNAKGWTSTPRAKLQPHTKKTNVEHFFAPRANVWIKTSCQYARKFKLRYFLHTPLERIIYQPRFKMPYVFSSKDFLKTLLLHFSYQC